MNKRIKCNHHNGYVGKDLAKKLFIGSVQLIAHIKNNMKNCLMTVSDKTLLRKRFVIETVNDELKNIYQIEHFRYIIFLVI
uniref:transposase n=1 Tax=Tenacibaculum sediminilitoris TaxID=1820334 RepID=UPI0038B67409